MNTSTHRFIRIKQVQERTGLSRSHIYALMARNEFPRQTKISERCAAWVESDVLAWIDSKLGKNIRATIDEVQAA